MSAPIILTAFAVLAFVPLAWAGAVTAVRACVLGWRSGAPLSDRAEKALLAIMLAPVFLGAALLAAPEAPLPITPPPLLDFVDVAIGGVAPTLASAPVGAGPDWFIIIALVLMALFTLGFARTAAPLLRAQLKLLRLPTTPHPHLAGVEVSRAITTPLALTRGRVVLPERLLAALSTQQQALIVAHERRHHARGDVTFYALLAWLEAFNWFNPFVRGQARNCRLAAELDCDAAATAAAPEMRRTYAQTLLTVLKHAAGDALQCAPAVFSPRTIGDHRMRIANIMGAAAAPRKHVWAVFAAAALLAAPMAAAQLAMAQTSSAQAAPQFADVVAAAAPVFTHRPLDGRVSSTFGERTDPFNGARRFHAGVDIVAPEGTAIVAPADGRVLRMDESDEGYGNRLEIAHAGGFITRYSQLSAFEVSGDAEVRAGQVIARVGATGRSTGPHLHLELWRDGVVLNPAEFIDLPEAR